MVEKICHPIYLYVHSEISSIKVSTNEICDGRMRLRELGCPWDIEAFILSNDLRRRAGSELFLPHTFIQVGWR